MATSSEELGGGGQARKWNFWVMILGSEGAIDRPIEKNSFDFAVNYTTRM
jgi:hypothetical protein